ncbi:class I SAM-dependent methyltransferase [Candidatus Parcubacteria bacterium]|nr:class I SAM-dependent methyltransferase [Candidatus Parcubacteria bacterium]
MSDRYLRAIQNNIFTDQGPESFAAKCIRNWLAYDYYSSNDSAKVKVNREKYWGSTAGKKWHETFKSAHVQEGNLSHEYQDTLAKSILVKQLVEFTTHNRPDKGWVVVEIGTGNGFLLEYLSSQLNGITRFVGIDLNAEQVAENQSVFADSSTEYIHGEITEWVTANQGVKQHVIFVTCGVLQYFAEKELRELFLLMGKSFGISVLAFNEPVSFDLQNNPETTSRGLMACLFNYPAILAECGFHINSQHIEHDLEKFPHFDRMNLVASNGCAANEVELR